MKMALVENKAAPTAVSAYPSHLACCEVLTIATGYTTRSDLSRYVNFAHNAWITCSFQRKSLTLFDMSMTSDPDVRRSFQDALRAHQAGKLSQAERGYRQILKSNPNHRDSLHLLGVVHLSNKRLLEARQSIEKALALGADVAPICFNLARCLEELGVHDEALAMYHRAEVLTPNDPDIHLGVGSVMLAQKKWHEAIVAFERVVALSPKTAEAYSNMGIAHKFLGEFDTALICYDKAIAIRQNFDEAHSNRGSLLEQMLRYDDAIVSFSNSISLNPRNAIAYRNRGVVHGKMKRKVDAVSDFQKAFALDEKLPDLLGLYVQAKMQICEWSNLPDYLAKLERSVLTNKKVCQPIVAARTLNSLEAALNAAQSESDAWPVNTVEPTADTDTARRLRVGYISSDLHQNHPVYQAIIGVLERHDPAAIDLCIYLLPTNKKRNITVRLQSIVGKIHVLDNMTDTQISDLIRGHALDIAVDLNGHTKHARPAIFASRVAPVQVNYLGFPGTLGSKAYQYIIADEFVVPRDGRKFYTEKIVEMPNSFFPVDRARIIDAAKPSRTDQGLPENAFVFGCFCAADRILPTTFKLWMSILKRVPDSVLWLKADDQIVRQNLLAEARKHAVEPQRIVFSGRMESNAAHLARLQLIDLCLDTLPYNSHMTALDALYAGVPLLTCAGKTFAGRVAGSLLHAVGLPDMICNSLAEYENRAVTLAQTPDELVRIAAKLREARSTAPLFDTTVYTRHIEAAYIQMMERLKSGQPFEDIKID